MRQISFLLFPEKLSFVVKKMDGKTKTNIGELSKKEIQEIMDNTVPRTTERSEWERSTDVTVAQFQIWTSR